MSLILINLLKMKKKDTFVAEIVCNSQISL